jgi:large subunit ribosomal protein L10
MKRSVKVTFIEDYTDKFDRAVLAILADYRGLDVETINTLRKELRTHAVGEFHVVKNSLCRRLLQDTDKAGLIEYFKGPTSVYFSYDDPIAPTKTLVKFAKDNKAFALRAGYFAGNILDEARIKQLSEMPSKEVLRAQLLGLLQAPSRNLVSLLANVPRGLLNVLNAHKAKLEEDAA